MVTTTASTSFGFPTLLIRPLGSPEGMVKSSISPCAATPKPSTEAQIQTSSNHTSSQTLSILPSMSFLSSPSSPLDHSLTPAYLSSLCLILLVPSHRQVLPSVTLYRIPRSYTFSSLQSLRGPPTAPTSASSLAPPLIYISPSIRHPKQPLDYLPLLPSFHRTLRQGIHRF